MSSRQTHIPQVDSQSGGSRSRGSLLERDPPARLVFAWLFLGSSMAAYGVFLLSMLSLLVAGALGLHEASLGLAFAALGLGGLASPFLAGLLADRAGPRPISLVGLGFVSAGALLAAFSPNAFVLVAGEFLVGGGSSMFAVVAYAWINESLGERKGFYLGVYVTSLVVGLAMAGLSVALLLPVVSSWRTYFLVAGLLVPIPALALWGLLPRRLGVPALAKDIRKALRDPDVRWVGGLQFLIGLGGGGFSWLPWFLAQERGFELRVAVLAFVAGAALWGLGGVAFGRLADAGWTKPTIVLGGLATGLAYLAFVLANAQSMTLGFLFLYAFAWPAGAQLPVTFLGQRLGAKAQRTELGLLENLFLGGDAVGAAMVGFLAGAWGLSWALAIVPGAAIFAAALLFGWAYGLGHGVEVATAEQRARPSE